MSVQSDTPDRIRELLRERPQSGGELALRMGKARSSITRWLQVMQGNGEVSQQGIGARTTWSLTGEVPAAPIVDPYVEIESPAIPGDVKPTSDRLALVEELLQIERVLAEELPRLTARRAEILGLLK